MTADCLTDRRHVSAERRLHDAVVGLAVTVILIIPATLAIFTAV